MINDAAIRNLLIVVAGLLIMVVGIMILAKSSKAQFSETARISANAIIGVMLVAAGAGALLLVAFGQSIIETILPGNSTGQPPRNLGGLGADIVGHASAVAKAAVFGRSV